MAKSAGAGKCVHCLEEVQERNWDHVLPESWYPETTPSDIEKWKVPSCIKCNKDYGKIEQDLLIRFGLCLDPHHPDTKSIVEKALRSIKPEYGRDRKDRQARQKKQKKIMREMTIFRSVPDHGIFPNFGPLHAPSPEGYIGVALPKHQLEQLAKKIVKGVAFVEDKVFIDEKYSLDIYVLNDVGAAPVIEAIEKYGVELHRGPGLVVRRAVIPEDRQSGLYAIEIWGRAKLYAAVIPKCVEGADG